MKKKFTLEQTTLHSRKMLIAFGAAITVAGVTTAAAQVSWSRQAYGQGPFYPPDHQGDPFFAFYYPNNHNWSQEVKFAYDNSNPPKPLYKTEPSNWSSDAYPRGGNVFIGNGGLGTGAQNSGTSLDGAAKSGEQAGVMNLNNLTIGPNGALNVESGTRLTANFYNFQGKNSADAVLTANGGGGPVPVIVIPAGGTMKKTTGTATFQLDPLIHIEAINGGTIACDAGALQLPGSGSYYAGPLQPTITPMRFNATTGALIDLAPATNSIDSAMIRIAGYFTGINTGGTVRLNKGWLGTVADTGGAVFKFDGDTFQWQGGAIVSTLADPFVNAGTMNITGTPYLVNVGFRNQGMVIESGAGLLNLPGGTAFTNLASGTFDFRNDNGLTANGGGGALPVINNSGTLLKSAGTGRSVIDRNINVNNIGGTVRVDTGMLACGSGLATRNGTGDGGTFVVAPGAKLELNDGTSDGIYNGTYTGSGGGTVSLKGGTIGADIDKQPGGFTFNLPAGMFRWTGGTISASTNTPFINAGYITLAGPVAVSGIGFTNNGAIIQGGQGTLNIPPGYRLTNGASGTYDLRADRSIISQDGTGAFDNSGTFVKSSGTGTSSIGSIFYLRAGSLIVRSGTLALSDLRVSGGLIDLSGGKLSVPNDLVLNDATLEGSGSITGTVRNDAGVVSPGHSPGKITITGNYTQAANGALDMEIGGATPGTKYDQLVVTGTATLGGTLNITFINGYTPHVGDVFTFVSATSFSGSFATLNVNGTGYAGTVDYSTNGVTFTVTSVPSQLVNISTRLRVLTDDNVLIGGFIVTGTQPKKVIIRGIGPSLSIDGELADPVLELHQGATVLATNDNWKDTQQAAIEASTVAPTDDFESAIVQTLQPGTYTAVLSGKNRGTGIGLVEVYDLSQAATSKLANISTRGFVDTGDNVMIGGFIAGDGSGNTRVIVRAIGPSLGIPGALQDPLLELHNANGVTIQSNDDWQQVQKQEIIDTGVAPTDDRESALVATLAPGKYTAVVSGKNGTGVGLVEVYDIP
jgi:hypothetical protein